MFTAADCVMQGSVIPEELLAPMVEVQWSDAVEHQQLHKLFEEHGYILVRGALDVDEALAARQEVFDRLVEVGEIREPAIEGIATGESHRVERTESLGEFWQSVSEGSALRVASHGARIRQVMDTLYGEESRPHDFMFLRPSVVGRATQLHYDLPFFARGSQRIVTVWSALGDIPVCDGSLAVVEGSHKFKDLIEPVRQIDYDSKDSPQVQLLGDAVPFLRERESRFLTTDFRVGDIVIFSMTTLHGTLDNHSPIQRARLSSDVRWQPAADPMDERYFGPNPAGTTGIGYAELNGAKPLTQDWHTR